MLRGYRGILGALAGLAALFTAAGFGAFYGSVYAPEKRHYQSVGPSGGQTYPASSPKNGLADVSGIDGLTQSIIAKPQPRSTEEREQRDLAAQETSAVFAYWVFWAMILQTALAAGALYALMKDLRQNRRSAEIQLRAFIRVRPTIPPPVGGLPISSVEMEAVNYGQTPARMVRISGTTFLGPSPLPENFKLPGLWHDLGTANAIHPDDPQNFGIMIRMSKEDARLVRLDGVVALYVIGRIDFTDEFGNPRTEQACHRIRFAGDGTRFEPTQAHSFST